MTSTNPSKSFKNVFDTKRVYHHYEKLKVENSLCLSESIASFEVMYKKWLAAKTPSQLSKFRDVLEGDSKIETAQALSELKGGVTCVPPRSVVTGLDVRARSDLAIRRLVHSDIVNNAVLRAGVLVCTEGSTGEMQATLRMSGVFTDEGSSDKSLDLLRTAPGILCNTDAFTKAIKCMNAEKEVRRGIVMPLVDMPYGFVEVETAEVSVERLEREKARLQGLLDAALKSQEDPKVPKRSRAEADDPGARESRKVAEEGKQAKAEADQLVDRTNKQTTYERIDVCLAEYGTLVRSFTSTIAWFKSGRKAVRQMLVEHATVAEQKKAAKVARKADKVIVPETREDESESESEAEDSEDDPPPRKTCVRVCSRVVSLRS